jgi:hypothetical protein
MRSPSFKKTEDGLEGRGLVTPARFVRLYGRFGYPER